MTTCEKLDLMTEMEERNELRRKAYLRTAGIHDAIEVSAGAILDGLDVLAQTHGARRRELVELLIDTLQALEQTREQEDG